METKKEPASLMRIIKVRFKHLIYGGPSSLTQELHAKDGWVFNVGSTGTLLYVWRAEWGTEEAVIPISDVASMTRVREQDSPKTSRKEG
jgi:hypothetical protein